MRPLRPIFIASFLFNFQLALLLYLNSSVLAVHGSPLRTTLAYTAGSMLSIILLVMSPRIVRRLGASIFLIVGLGCLALLLWGLGVLTFHAGFATLFVVYFSLNVVIWYAFDLVIEHYSRESLIGNIRGLTLTLDNTGVMLAPVIASVIIGFAGFGGAYLVGGIIVIVCLSIIGTTPILPKLHTPRATLNSAFRALVKHAEARRLVVLYFALEFFYAWMVLYMAPYLLSLGFGWSTIGLIFSIMLVPFVILQYGVGKLADRFHAERTIIICGFLIAAGATALLAFHLPPIAAVFASILFATRIGASIVEVGCESAFFKHVKESDTALIGTLRMTLPLAYIIAPLCGVLILSFGSARLLFGVLASILVLAALYTLHLKKR